MVSHDAWQHTFQFLSKKPIVVEPVEAQLTSPDYSRRGLSFSSGAKNLPQFGTETLRRAQSDTTTVRVWGI